MKRIFAVGALVFSGVLWPAHFALAAQDWDACSMLLKSDVEAVFAPRVFQAAELGHKEPKLSAKMADVSSCTYSSEGSSVKDRLSVGLLARRAPDDASGLTPQAAKEGAIQLKGVPVDVLELGEGAYWVNMGSKSFPVIQLNVFKGKRLWFVFSVTTRTMPPQTALAALVKLAKVWAAHG